MDSHSSSSVIGSSSCSHSSRRSQIRRLLVLLIGRRHRRRILVPPLALLLGRGHDLRLADAAVVGAELPVLGACLRESAEAGVVPDASAAVEAREGPVEVVVGLVSPLGGLPGPVALDLGLA
ncbi:hypothetical protein ABZP36_021613 [Zizania latifolia]